VSMSHSTMGMSYRAMGVGCAIVSVGCVLMGFATIGTTLFHPVIPHPVVDVRFASVGMG
jgi:hypothetical protein